MKYDDSQNLLTGHHYYMEGELELGGAERGELALELELVKELLVTAKLTNRLEKLLN